MADSKSPKQPRWKKDPARQQRHKYKEQRGALSDEKQKRVVLHQSIGNHKGSKLQQPFAIYAHGIFSKLSGAVNENIHKFQPIQRKKAERRTDEK